LHAFVEVAEERVSLRRDLKQITEDLSNGKLGRHDFNRRRRVILQGLATLDREFASLKEKVKKMSTSYAEVLRQLEVADIELDSTSSNLSRIETEFRANKVSKDTYEKLRYEYIRKIDKTITTINGILLSLREEIG
jgi:chromosome segregation ATPase